MTSISEARGGKPIRTRRRLRRVLTGVTTGIAVGLAGLALAVAASPATITIQVGSLAVVSGSATGTISGFQPGATVTINGSSFVADATGVVTLSLAPLGGSAELQLGFVDSGGVARTASATLSDLTTGLPLTVAQITDAVPDTTAPVALVLDTGSGSTTTVTTTGSGTTTTATTAGTGTTTTTGTTTATGTTTTGTTTTTTGSSGGGSSSQVSGARAIADGQTSIPASSVVLPARLTIRRVVFSPRIVRSHKKAVVIRFRVADTRGFYVRNAAVYMRGVPLHRITIVKEKRTSMAGWVTFKVRPTKQLKLKRGGRLIVFVRARRPGEPLLGGTSTRRLVSLRVSTPQ